MWRLLPLPLNLDWAVSSLDHQNVTLRDFRYRVFRSFVAPTLALGPLPSCHGNQPGLACWRMRDHTEEGPIALNASLLQPHEGARETLGEEPLLCPTEITIPWNCEK